MPWSDIQKGYEQEVQKAVASAELPGFRKGKAPRNMVEPKLDRPHLYSHTIQHLLPKVYADAIKLADLKPILYPKITITKGEEGQDWEFQATTCEAPKVELPEKLAKLEELQKKVSVVIPDLLVEEESNHRLAALAENLSNLGLTTASYLQTKKITLEDLKAQTSQAARSDLQLEFILNAVQKSQSLPDRKATLDFLQKLV